MRRFFIFKRMNLLRCFLLLLAVPSYAQTARFIADSSQLRMRTGFHAEAFHRAMEMEWVIAGKTLHWGDTLEVPGAVRTGGLDRILYRGNKSRHWDTLYGSIRAGQTYIFDYNDCCDAFNVRNSASSQFTVPAVKPLLHDKSSTLYYVLLGESAMITRAGLQDTLKNVCKSAVTPDIFLVEFSTIRHCNDSAGCLPVDECLFLPGEKEVYYGDYYYQTQQSIARFVYIPLQDEVLYLVYDPATQILSTYTN